MLIFRTKILHSLIVFIVLGAFSYGLSIFTIYDSKTIVDIERIEKTIYKKQQKTLNLLKEAAKKISNKGIDWYIKNEAQQIQRIYQEEGIALVVYKNWNLRVWPENSVIVPEVFGSSDFEAPFIRLGNSYFVTVLYKAPDIDLVGLVHIKSEYDSSSEMVEDYFNPDFYLSPDIKISQSPLQEPRILNYNNEYLFSLKTEKQPIQNTAYSWIIFLFLTGTLTAFFRLFMLIFSYKKKDNNYYPYLIFSLVFIIVMRGLMLKYQFPGFLYNFKLFSPEIFASTWIAPSLGDLILNSIFTIFIVLFVRRRINLNDFLISKKKSHIYIYLAGFIIIISGFIIQLNNLLSSIIRDSTIEFQPFRILDMSAYSIIGFITIIINLLTFVLLFDWGIRFFKRKMKLKETAIILNIALFAIGVFAILIFNSLSWLSIFYYLLVINLVLYYRWKTSLKFTFVLIFAAASALYLTHIIDVQDNEKQYARMKFLSINVSVFQDFYAEMRFQEISRQLPADPYIDTLLSAEKRNEDELYQYLKRKYYGNYLSRYNMQMELCKEQDSIFVEESAVQWQHCREYYTNEAIQKGDPIFKSNYFFMGEEDSRLQYLGMHDITTTGKEHITLIIKLRAEIVKYNPGFTQLFDKYGSTGGQVLGEYSYARYNKGKIISKYGDCPYSLVDNPYKKSDREFSRICMDNYCHLVYQPTQNQTIVISYPTVSFFQLLVNFSYIFVFIFILLALITLYYIYHQKGLVVSDTIRNRIQFSMIGLLLVSLILIGGGSIYFISEAYAKKNMQEINEKLHSVISELQTSLANQESMEKVDTEYLNFMMQKLSRLFNSDISVFDNNGNLLSTSRPEVFNQDFLSRKMDFGAYAALKYFHRFKVIQQEHIGKLAYYSAYVPIVNKDNKTLGFVNLPFFSNHELLTEDISSIIVTFINVYVLLILLTIIIAVFLSNNVTRPLQVLRQKMRQIDLKKHNTPIDLKTEDEIGDLVKEYNHMVSELSRSVELLARQERETAWRSMARQVAHEIKNPLTPMKLSVQLMLRAWREKAPDFEQRLFKVSNTLIHQIETLSNIASEFSTFARMPNEQIEKVEINTLVKTASSIYDEYKDIEIKTDINETLSFYVMADKNRLFRMINNLLKNAAQAIDKEKKGLVIISTQQINDMVMIKVEDNGEGIPHEIRGKLFQPNFTTKTKGMGLGLAMVKNIVEGFGGKIWFETETGKGTTFYIQLPLIQ